MKVQNSEKHALDKTKLVINFNEGDVPSLHPHDLSSIVRGVTLCKYLYEGLTRLSLAGNYELAGAEKVEQSPCGKFYTFTLRENYYSNGEPVTAFDYENFWKEALKAESKCPNAHLLYCIKNAEKAKKRELDLEQVGVKALDDRTLSVELVEPCPYFLSLLSLPVFLPFKGEGPPLFNGPYSVEKWNKNDKIFLKSNPHFWDHSKIAIDNVEILMVQDVMAAFSLYEDGKIDWFGDPFCWLPSEILSNTLPNGRLSKGKDVMYPFWIYLNTEHFPLSSPLIRQALSSVISRNKISEHIFCGESPLLTPIPHEVFGENAITDGDVEKGRDFFEKGLKELGLTKATFPPLTLSSSRMGSFRRLAEYLQETWQKELGITVNLDIQEWGTFYANIVNGDYQAGGYFISSEYDDPLSCLETLSMANNRPQWNHPRYQEIMSQLKSATDPSRRKSLFREAQDILKNEMPVIWVVNKNQYYSYRKDLKGVCFDHQGSPDIRHAYFD